MSITQTIHSTVHAWVLLATGIAAVNVIPDKESSPEPTGPFFIINSNASENGVGFRDEQIYTASGVYTIRGHRERLVSLHSFGPNALDLMQQVKMSQSTPSVRRLFRDAGIELIETKNIRDLSKLKGARFETRAQMDLRVRYAQQITDAVDTIESIEYEIRVGTDTIEDTVSAP